MAKELITYEYDKVLITVVSNPSKSKNKIWGPGKKSKYI